MSDAPLMRKLERLNTSGSALFEDHVRELVKAARLVFEVYVGPRAQPLSLHEAIHALKAAGHVFEPEERDG